MTPSRFSPPPERCESLAAIVTRFGGTVQIHSPAERVTYPLPPHASAELRKFWQTETKGEMGPTFTAHLPGGRVYGTGNVLAPDGRSLAREVSPDFGKPFDDHWLLSFAKIPRPQRLDGTVAVIASTLGGGYGHWLLDELPRLLALPLDAARTLIAHHATPFSRTALALRAWPGQLLPADRSLHVECERLVIPSFVGTINQPARRGLELVQEFTASVTGGAEFGERIYLSRERARRRSVSNEAEVQAMLKAEGYAILHLEELTWAAQINAFRHAKIVVAPHGAGLANLVFSPPGTRVVECFNRSYVNGCFWRLASLQAHDYRPVVAGSDDPLSQATAFNRLPITIDLALLRQVLREL